MSAPTCLWCVSLDVGGLVMSYYDALGLEPWDVYARRRTDENRQSNRPAHESSRQTGRTTHGLLEAIALCGQKKITALSVTSLRGSGIPHLKECAINLVRHLELSIKVNRPGAIVRVKYPDHGTAACHP